jgi:hypothetical protein
LLNTRDRRGAKFDLISVVNNRFNGYNRTGRASKMPKAKRLHGVYTIGIPLLF